MLFIFLLFACGGKLSTKNSETLDKDVITTTTDYINEYDQSNRLEKVRVKISSRFNGKLGGIVAFELLYIYNNDNLIRIDRYDIKKDDGSKVLTSQTCYFDLTEINLELAEKDTVYYLSLEKDKNGNDIKVRRFDYNSSTKQLHNYEDTIEYDLNNRETLRTRYDFNDNKKMVIRSSYENSGDTLIIKETVGNSLRRINKELKSALYTRRWTEYDADNEVFNIDETLLKGDTTIMVRTRKYHVDSIFSIQDREFKRVVLYVETPKIRTTFTEYDSLGNKLKTTEIYK